jgi:hypothetical protein
MIKARVISLKSASMYLDADPRVVLEFPDADTLEKRVSFPHSVLLARGLESPLALDDQVEFTIFRVTKR